MSNWEIISGLYINYCVSLSVVSVESATPKNDSAKSEKKKQQVLTGTLELR